MTRKGGKNWCCRGAGASLWTEPRVTEAEASDLIPPDTELVPPLLHFQFYSNHCHQGRVGGYSNSIVLPAARCPQE